MKHSIMGLVLLASIASLPSAVCAQPQNAGSNAAAKHGWLIDYKTAKTLARKTGKPMMVVLRCVP